MSTVFVLSTMANSVTYRTYRMVGAVNKDQKQGPLPVPEANPITIRGGADRPSQKAGFGEQAEDINGNVIWTPRGVVTRLTQEQYDRVKEHPLFIKHMEGGYLAVVNADVADNHKKVTRKVEEMRETAQERTGDATAGQDRSKPLTNDTVAQRIKVKVPQKELSQEWN